MNKKNILLRNIFFYITLSLVLLHQIIVAVSAIFLTKLIEAAQAGTDYQIHLFAYLICMTTPYIPGYASNLALQAWINNAHKRYVEKLASLISNISGGYCNPQLKNKFESAAARSSFIIIAEALTFAHQFLGFTLNSLLSILMMYFILPGNIFLGYFISLALCSALILLTKTSIYKLSLQIENAFENYTGLLSKIWSNKAIHNKINSDSWNKKFLYTSNIYYIAKIKLETSKLFLNIILSAFALGPTIFLVVQALGNNSNPAILAAIIVNLTRIFHILSSLNALVSQSLEWPAIRSRLDFIIQINPSPRDLRSMDNNISKNISINSSTFDDTTQILEKIKKTNSGRFTIRGPNGAGKSSLLLMLKEKLPSNEVIYIPVADSSLEWPMSYLEASTGQKSMRILKYVIENTATKYILLDEWDANLDKENLVFIDRLIEKESLNRVFIEIRH